MKRGISFRVYALVSATVASLVATAGWSQSLTWLGTLEDGRSSIALGVSANGGVVVGQYHNANDNPRAFRWTANGGMQELPFYAPFAPNVAAYGVSADGHVVVGSYGDKVFRITSHGNTRT
jgi:probable HAF family extracellular repeat protein